MRLRQHSDLLREMCLSQFLDEDIDRDMWDGGRLQAAVESSGDLRVRSFAYSDVPSFFHVYTGFDTAMWPGIYCKNHLLTSRRTSVCGKCCAIGWANL